MRKVIVCGSLSNSHDDLYFSPATTIIHNNSYHNLSYSKKILTVLKDFPAGGIRGGKAGGLSLKKIVICDRIRNTQTENTDSCRNK